MSEAKTFEEWFLATVGVSFDDAKKRGVWDLGLIEQSFAAGQAYAIAAIEAQGVQDGLLAVLDNFEKKERSPFQAYLAAGLVNELRTAMLASAPPAPQAEVVNADQPHPTNNYLFKLLCQKAGIVLGVDRVDTAYEKVARMLPCSDSKCPNYWDDAYDDLKPSDIETDCEPAPQEVVEYQAPEPSLYVSEYELAQFNRVSDWMAATLRKHPGDGRVALYTHPAQQAKPNPLNDDRDARIAGLEQRNRDLYEDVQRFKEHALNEKDARLVLERQLEEARKDAERYRWLRKQHWSENLISVVVRPKDQTMIGSLLPCGSLLDDTVYHMQSTQEATLKGQQ